MAHYSMFSSQAPQELQIVINIHIYLNTFRTICDEKQSKILHSVIGRILYAGDFSRNGKLPANVLMEFLIGQGSRSTRNELIPLCSGNILPILALFL